MDERRYKPGYAGIPSWSQISCFVSRYLFGIPGRYSTKPRVSIQGDFWCVLMDYQGKISLNIPGNNPIPTPGPFRILSRRAMRRQGLFRKGNHTRHSCEISDKILCLFQILKQILRHISPFRGIYPFKRISTDFCNMPKALFARKSREIPFMGFYENTRYPTVLFK